MHKSRGIGCTADLRCWLFTTVCQVSKYKYFYLSSASVGEYKRSTKSFLFSLRNKDNLRPFKCPVYDNQNGRAIYCFIVYGAVFGDGCDLFISSNANTNQDSYANLGKTYRPPDGYKPKTARTRVLLAGSYKFTPTEIEVFRR